MYKLSTFFNNKQFSTQVIKYYSTLPDFTIRDLDLKYLCNEKNFKEIFTNIQRRKGPGDIKSVVELHKRYQNDSEERDKVARKLVEEAYKIPNRSHPDSLALSGEPKIVNEIGCDKHYTRKPFTFENIAKKLHLTRTDNLTNLTGDRSYYLLDQLAELEQGLISYAVDYLIANNFKLVSVPDILPRRVIEACGMSTQGERTQVYSLDESLHGKDLCLSGTAEMGIASLLSNKSFHSDKLPLKLAAVSRCFRAETSKIAEEKGLYRVHSFTKVEMFGVTLPQDSNALLSHLVSLEENFFSSLGLKLRTLDMPPEELGAQAYRKFDIEAWLPGKKRWAELSSASDCIDYQSRRLGIRLNDGFPHTLNGTAAAIPRLIIAIVETHQNPDASVDIPLPLQPYLSFKTLVKTRIPDSIPYKGRVFYQ